jgi:hypothetical protein
MQGPSSDADHFVKVTDGRFSLNCRSWYPHGWNQWETVEAAAGALQLFGASLPPNTTGPAVRGFMQSDGLSQPWARRVK